MGRALFANRCSLFAKDPDPERLREMPRFVLLCGAYLIIACHSSGQDKSMPLSLIQLIANPEKYNRKVVAVQGFLRIGYQKHHGMEATLYLHEEDAKQLLLSNLVGIDPNKQMVWDMEKLDRVYVRLIGVVRVVQATNGSYIVFIKDIRSCVPWSNPDRPIGLKQKDSP